MSPQLIALAGAGIILVLELSAALFRWIDRRDEYLPGSFGRLLPVWITLIAMMVFVSTPAAFFQQYGCDIHWTAYIYIMAMAVGMMFGRCHLTTPPEMLLARLRRPRR